MASTMLCRFPSRTGITSNTAGVVDPAFHLLTGARGEVGASPLRFQGSTLTDCLSAKDSRSHALSVSMKGRAAIRPIGRSKQDVHWDALNASLTSDIYYRDILPAVVRALSA